MPRKRTETAIIKASRTEEEKRLARQRSRAAANRRYRHKFSDTDREKARVRMRERRKNMTEQDRERAKERQQQYNYNYYSLNRDRLLHKAYRKRAMDFMEKHGEEAFVTGYKHRTRKEKPREPQFEAVEEDLDNLDNDDVLPYSSDDDFQ